MLAASSNMRPRRTWGLRAIGHTRDNTSQHVTTRDNSQISQTSKLDNDKTDADDDDLARSPEAQKPRPLRIVDLGSCNGFFALKAAYRCHEHP